MEHTISLLRDESVINVYNQFVELYFSADIKVRYLLLKRIANSIQNPVYTHLLRTMDTSNAKYIMGYLRSQNSFELYNILEQTVNSALPLKDDFFST